MLNKQIVHESLYTNTPNPQYSQTEKEFLLRYYTIDELNKHIHMENA